MKHTMRRILSFVSIVLFAVFAISCSTSPDSDSGSDDSAALPPEEVYAEEPVNPLPADFSKSALDIVVDMGAGWNLGNTLDATGTTDLNSETSWSQPLTTRAMMKGLYDSGIRTVRIPISWHNHMNEAYTIDAEWMARVREVVDYAIDEGLYVIINIHHDNGVGGYYPDADHRKRAVAYAERVWKQVALQFRNYDEKLVFEFLNEPRLVGYSNEWGWSDGDSYHAEAAEVIGEMEQAALDAVRATDGNNDDRYVMVTPYVASPWAAFSSKFDIPEDSVEDRIILSVHAYTPYIFAMQDPGVSKFTDAHKGEIDTFIGRLNEVFVEGKKIPVIIGEYGATNKNNLSDRVSWFSYYVSKAASYGMCTILWDNGNYAVPSSGKFEELYGFYDRENQRWYSHEILAAILGALK